MKKTIALLTLLFVSLIIVSQNFHKEWTPHFSTLLTDPPDLYNDYFAGAGSCMMCHNSMTDEQGNSIAIVNDWRSTIMANAAKDPFWQAKVSHEVLVNPHLQAEIETVCTRCHAPMGNINAMYNGQEHYSLAEMQNDPIALDGVSCTACHQITPESMGNYSGTFIINTNKTIYGPYTNPFGNPMINNTTYSPTYSEHIKDSKLCGSCHTLITNPLDLDGVPTGGEFVEQAPLQEWQNSTYHETGTSCFTCHVPEIQDVVTISTMPPNLTGRTPFGKHHFAGGNVFMLRMFKTNIDELGITANETQFDSTINRTIKNLQLNTLDLSLVETERTDDTLFIELNLKNKAGHKLPTAYPSRRVFVELFTISENDDTIFHSGKFDGNFSLINEDFPFEQHHQIINNENQVQIYEMVMGDVNGNYTTVLERSAIHLKDNRIPPVGFTKSHFSYDTIQIVGEALSDDNFNYNAGVEGSGEDKVFFHIPINGNQQQLEVRVNVYYQTVNDKWLTEMFTYSSEEIDRFKSMYENADKSPVLLKSASIVSNFLNQGEYELSDIVIFPNPSEGTVTIYDISQFENLSVFSANGKLIHKEQIQSNNLFNMRLFISDKKGLYFVVLQKGKQSMVKKIIVR